MSHDFIILNVIIYEIHCRKKPSQDSLWCCIVFISLSLHPVVRQLRDSRAHVLLTASSTAPANNQLFKKKKFAEWMNKILFLCFTREFKLSPVAQHSLVSLKNKIQSLRFDQGSDDYKTWDKARSHATCEIYPYFIRIFTQRHLTLWNTFHSPKMIKKALQNDYCQVDKIYKCPTS